VFEFTSKNKLSFAKEMVSRIRKGVVLRHLFARRSLHKSEEQLECDGNDFKELEFERHDANEGVMIEVAQVTHGLEFSFISNSLPLALKFNSDKNVMEPYNKLNRKRKLLIEVNEVNLSNYMHPSVNMERLSFLLFHQMQEDIVAKSVDNQKSELSSLLKVFLGNSPEIEVKLWSAIRCKGDKDIDMDPFIIKSTNAQKRNKHSSRLVDNFSCLEIRNHDNVLQLVKVASIISVCDTETDIKNVYLIVIPFEETLPNKSATILPYSTYCYQTAAKKGVRQTISFMIESNSVNFPACVIPLEEARNEQKYTSLDFKNNCFKDWRFRQITIPKFKTIHLNEFNDDPKRKLCVQEKDDPDDELQLPLYLNDDEIEKVDNERHFMKDVPLAPDSEFSHNDRKRNNSRSSSSSSESEDDADSEDKNHHDNNKKSKLHGTTSDSSTSSSDDDDNECEADD